VRVRADLAAQGYTGKVYFGKQFLDQYRDPTAAFNVIGYGTINGSVLVIPIGRGKLRAPRLLGGNPRPLFTLSRTLEVHCWSQAPIGSFATQYEADLSAAETLTAAVLRSFEIYVPGAKDGGDSQITDAGENIAGVETVTTLEVNLEIPDTTYQLATGTVFVPGVLLQFGDGTTDG
jgi:hypothetical protein